MSRHRRAVRHGHTLPSGPADEHGYRVWISAGGVVLRGAPKTVEVALVGRGSPPRWALPKGTREDGEALEDTAVREVEEETGLRVRLVAPLESIVYRFRLNGVRYHKTVHFYLMESVGGDPRRHDHEYDTAGWFPVEEALKRIVYPNEARLVDAARQLVGDQ